MMAFSESSLAKFSSDEFEKYMIFDASGIAVGVKEDAPNDFKVAYEADKKLKDDALKKGIVL